MTSLSRFAVLAVCLSLVLYACKKKSSPTTPETPPPPSNTSTFTPTSTSSLTATFTATFTLTGTPTSTATQTDTPTETLSPTETSTPTITFTPTETLTPTVTSTFTVTSTPTDIICPASGQFGHTAYLEGTDMSSEYLHLKPVTFTSAVTVDNLVTWGWTWFSDSCIVEGGLYTDHNGAPQSLLVAGGPVTTPDNVTNYPLTITLNQPVAAGTYWFGIRGTSANSIFDASTDVYTTESEYLVTTNTANPLPVALGSGNWYQGYLLTDVLNWHCN